MYWDNKIWIGDADGEKVFIRPEMANRHGLITGATGTGKTVTLKVLAESFSEAGVPVFLADIKGDLSGMCRPGENSMDLQERIQKFALLDHGFSTCSYPTAFWDVFGKSGIPLRTTISEMGPLLLAKLMDLNETQTDVLTVVFKIADDQELLLIDTKDLKSMLQYVGEHNKEFAVSYGNVSKQSIGAIVRGVVALEAQGAEQFFGEPAFHIADWFAGGLDGRGMINVLDCRELACSADMYSTFLLWMLSELFEELPEIGDTDKPRMVFFFDEAHLLFQDISKVLREKIEQVVRLIRSKGVSVWFISQSPGDIPDTVLGQLGNKIQHALRAYTPSDAKKVKAAADSLRANPAFDTREAIESLGTGEALVSALDESGIPEMVKRCRILPPRSLMGAIAEEEKQQETLKNNLYLKYRSMEDRDSAYEFLMRKSRQDQQEAALAAEQERMRKEQAREEERLAKEQAREEERLAKEQAREEERLAREQARAAEKLAREQAREQERLAKEREQEAQKWEKTVKSSISKAANTAGGTLGREIGNTVGKGLGGSFGKRLGGNVGASLGRSILGNLLKF